VKGWGWQRPRAIFISGRPGPPSVIAQRQSKPDKPTRDDRPPHDPELAVDTEEPPMRERELEQLLESARYDGPIVSADELVGVDACLNQLQGQLNLIRRPELGQQFGVQPSGTLFLGPPGTGKTMLARYLAGVLGMPMYQLSADQFGNDPRNIHQVFARLGNQRALLFIDEVSIICQRREWASAEDRRMLAALLTELDGLATAPPPERLWVIGASTPDIALDAAVTRSGRLGVTVEIALPSQAQRADLLRLYLRPLPHRVSAQQIEKLAEMSGGASGADIRDYVSQAASLVLGEAADIAEPVIEQRHLEVVFGRRGFVAAESRPGREPDWETAVHEPAHATLAYVLFGRPALARVTIGFGRISRRGFARGHFEFSREWAEANKPNSRSWPDHVAVSLAGVCAEEVILGYRGFGADSDARDATQLILGQLDQSDPAFGPNRSTIEAASGTLYAVAGSEPMRAQVWFLTRQRFAECWQTTQTLVARHREQIEVLARVLLNKKAQLTGDEIVDAIESIEMAA
jgi:SpoVK/Ycf46/Vps4 family AAA+-type ATPase